MCSPGSCGGSDWPTPREQPDPAIPPFQGGMIGLPRLRSGPADRTPAAPDSARFAAARYPPGTLRHGRHRRRPHRTGPALGLGPDSARAARPPKGAAAPGARPSIARSGRRDRLDDQPRSISDPHQARSTAKRISRPCAGSWNISRPATSSRSTCRNGSRPTGGTIRSTFTCGSKNESPAPFAAFLHWKDLAVVSASPESFYQTPRRRPGHPADQGNPAAGHRPRRRRPARRRACSPHPKTAPS